MLDCLRNARQTRPRLGHFRDPNFRDPFSRCTGWFVGRARVEEAEQCGGISADVVMQALRRSDAPPPRCSAAQLLRCDSNKLSSAAQASDLHLTPTPAELNAGEMSSRRSARASAASRQSYREDSDEDHAAPDDLTEDEYEQHDAASAEDDEPEPEPSDSDEQRESSRSAKRRKTGSSTPSSRAAASKAAQNSDWAPGVTRVVAKLVGAPTTDHVPKGELSPNVLRFLSDLAANNDRDWFAQHDAVYRYCWTNFGDFVSAVLDDIMTHVDPTVPWLPPKTSCTASIATCAFRMTRLPTRRTSWHRTAEADERAHLPATTS